MGLLSRLLGRDKNSGRRDFHEESGDTPDLQEPQATPSMQRPQRPEPTPSMHKLPDFGATAGTRTHRSPHGTPSTERIHNPRRVGR
jgi:hypothetical protein